MGPVPWLDVLEQSAWRALLRAHSRVLQRLDRELMAVQNIPVAEYAVLVVLSESPDGRMRMSELADELLLSPSGLTRRLDAMVNQGLVERVRCANDRRGSFAVITPLGRKRIEEAAPDHVRHVRKYFVDLLSRDDLAHLESSLGKVVAGPDQQTVPS